MKQVKKRYFECNMETMTLFKTILTSSFHIIDYKNIFKLSFIILY